MKENFSIITLNNPNQKNVLSKAILTKLDQDIDDVKKDPNIRAVIFTGAGKEAFCAGADLKERFLMREDEVLATVKLIQDTFNKIALLEVPTIAAINGLAFGGGLELALACDIRLACHDAKMGLTECSLGVIPGAGGTQRLPNIIGIAKACELIFTAKKINAQEALKIGLVNDVCDLGEDVLARASKIAQIICKQAPLSIKASKKALYKNINIDLDFELLCYKEILYSQDRKEGLRAFKEKREASFIGK